MTIQEDTPEHLWGPKETESKMTTEEEFTWRGILCSIRLEDAGGPEKGLKDVSTEMLEVYDRDELIEYMTGEIVTVPQLISLRTAKAMTDAELLNMARAAWGEEAKP